MSPTDPTSQIYVSAIDGSGIAPLTAETSATGDANTPVWSPDGSKIAYIGVVGGLEQVFVMNADGSSKTQLTTDAVNHDQVPDWLDTSNPCPSSSITKVVRTRSSRTRTTAFVAPECLRTLVSA